MKKLISLFTVVAVLFMTGCGGADREQLETMWKGIVTTEKEILASVEKIKDESSLKEELPRLQKLGKELEKQQEAGSKIQARVSVVRSVGGIYEKQVNEIQQKIDAIIQKLEEKKVDGVIQLREWFSKLPKIISGGKKK